MKIYRIALTLSNSELWEGVRSAGFLYAASRKKATAAATAWRRANKTGKTAIAQIEVNPTRDGIIKALINYGGHPDNG